MSIPGKCFKQIELIKGIADVQVSALEHSESQASTMQEGHLVIMINQYMYDCCLHYL